MGQDSPKNHLKDQIESEEMILKTKVLEVRSQVAKKIENAQQEADIDFQKRLKEIEKKQTGSTTQTETKFKKLVQELENEEKNTLQEIRTKYKQREDEIINNLLKQILP